MQPGDVIRLRRGEHIWLSTDGLVPAEALLASAYVEPRGALRRWLARWSAPASNYPGPIDTVPRR